MEILNRLMSTFKENTQDQELGIPLGIQDHLEALDDGKSSLFFFLFSLFLLLFFTYYNSFHLNALLITYTRLGFYGSRVDRDG